MCEERCRLTAGSTSESAGLRAEQPAVVPGMPGKLGNSREIGGLACARRHRESKLHRKRPRPNCMRKAPTQLIAICGLNFRRRNLEAVLADKFKT
jgi:hypothetical protein